MKIPTVLKLIGNLIAIIVFDIGILVNLIELNAKGIHPATIQNLLSLLVCAVFGLVSVFSAKDNFKQLVLEVRAKNNTEEESEEEGDFNE